LLLMILVAFGQTIAFTFINLDDHNHVDANPMVYQGVTVQGIVWAFTKSHVANWHPMTSLSHMVDCEIFGRSARGHHLTNVLLHAAATLLLFLALRRMTGLPWPSALAAALFAVHPMRAESVAWVTERKDVLSGLFFTLTLWAYARYVDRRSSFGRYAMVMLWLALGLMSKAMLVTTPLVLLLLDYWPLRRQVSITRLILEKIPLLALVAAASLLTVAIQGDTLAGCQRYPLPWRVGNSLIAYVTYLGHTFWPVHLSAIYPRLPVPLPPWQAPLAAAILVAVTAAVFALRRRCPYLLVGWLWYLGMLTPVIGLLQVGMVSVADRFAYLPHVGLAIALAFGAADLVRSWRCPRWVCIAAGSAVLATLMACAWHETSFWRDSKTLWSRALEHTKNNCMAHYCLGLALSDAREYPAAIREYRDAMAICSDMPEIHSHLGVALLHVGQPQEALDQFQTALRINPDYVEGHNQFGAALAELGRPDEAQRQYEIALRLDPRYAQAHQNLANRFVQQGNTAQALKEYETALAIDPDYPDAHCNLGKLLTTLGRPQDALKHYNAAMHSAPNHAATLANCAWLLATCPDDLLRDGETAVEYAEHAKELSDGKQPDVLVTLAAAYAEVGRFAEALAIADRALRLATDQRKSDVAAALRFHIMSYEAHRPWRQKPTSDM
jgi:protein O-mannosyl-transferase